MSQFITYEIGDNDINHVIYLLCDISRSRALFYDYLVSSNVKIKLSIILQNFYIVVEAEKHWKKNDKTIAIIQIIETNSIILKIIRIARRKNFDDKKEILIKLIAKT